MKNLYKPIFASFLICVLVNLSGCKKEQAEPTVSPSDISLSLQENTEVKQYAGQTSTFHFSIKVPDPTKSSITFSTTGPGEVELDKSILAGSGKLSVTLDKEAASDVNIVITLSCSNASKKYTVTVTPYFFRGEIKTVVVGPDATSRAGVEYTVDTNLDSYRASLELADNKYFALEGEEVVALRGNVTGEDRTCTIFLKESSGMFKNIYGTVCQSTLPPLPPEQIVHFQDVFFKNAMLELCDVNQDDEVSLEEALAVTEINVAGKGIRNLAGLESFKNVWKFDAQDNDIVDGSVIKELPLLYWLDLKGNMNLQTFDVTSCTVYFEHCEFEVTDNLLYYVGTHQMGVEDYSDMYCLHSKHILDDRQTTDWSNQDEMKLLRRHTRGDGFPIVITGRDWIDVDIQDGSADRIANNYIEFVISKSECFIDVFELLDFYILYHKAENRLKFAEDWSYYYLPDGTPSFQGLYPGWEEINKAFWADQNASFPTCYEILFGRNLDDTYRLIVINLNLGGAPNGAITWCNHLGNFGSDRDTIFPGWDWGNTEYGFFLGYQTMTVFQERTYTDGAPERAYYVPFYYGVGGTEHRLTLNEQYPPVITTNPRAYKEAFDKLREKYLNK